MLKRLYRNPQSAFLILAAVALIFFISSVRTHVLRPAVINDFFRTMVQSREDQLRAFHGNFYEVVTEINAAASPDSLVLLPSNRPLEFQNVPLVTYFLFPRVVDDEAHTDGRNFPGPVYRLLTPAAGEHPACPESFSLTEGFELCRVTNGRVSRSPQQSFTDRGPDFPGIMRAAAGFALICLAGMWPVVFYGREKSAAGFWVSSFLAGCVLYAIAFLGMNFMSIPVYEGESFALLTVLSLVSIFLLKKASAKGVLSLTAVRPQISWLPLAIIWGILFLKSASLPIWGDDEAMIWGLHAKAIALTGKIDSVNLWSFRSSYPPLLPVIMAFASSGGEMFVKLLFPGFAFCLYVLLRDEIKQVRAVEPFAGVLALAVFFQPPFFRQILRAFSDLAGAVFLFKLFLMVHDATDDNRSKAGRPISPWYPALLACGVFLMRPLHEINVLMVSIYAWRRLARQYRPAGRGWQHAALLTAAVYFFWLLYRFRFLESIVLEAPDWVRAGPLYYDAFLWILKALFSPHISGWILILFLFWSGVWPKKGAAYYRSELILAGGFAVWVCAFTLYGAPGWGMQHMIVNSIPRYLIPAGLVLVWVMIQSFNPAMPGKSQS